ncbi:MAG TPA: hypothetical protein VFV63_08700 [Ilumatobacteraceae bacterium]|nr:hypothetical protein [Ilumatobacteraceae bacterium]
MFTVQTLPGFDDPAAPAAPSVASINSDGIADIVDAALDDLDGQLLLSQGRCVNVLLDLFNVTTEPSIQALIGERLDDIRHLRAVEADEFRADLYAVAAIAAAEAALVGA